MKQRLNIQTGEFTIHKNLTISRHLHDSEISRCFGEKLIIREKFNNGTSILLLRNLKIDDLYFNISFNFKEDVLSRFEFVLNTIPSPEVASWDDFDIEVEKEKGLLMTKWFENQTKNQSSESSWGMAVVAYDFHNWMYSIIVTYNQNN